MKKTLTIVLVTLSALLIIDSADAFHALVMFFLAGVIPGTHIAVDASVMLMFFAMMAGLTMSRLTAHIFVAWLKKQTPQIQQA